MSGIWAIIPVKEFGAAKHRLAPLLRPALRLELAAVMLEDVLAAVAGARRLAGIAVVTLDARATSLAAGIGARVIAEGARDGHTGSVDAARRILAAEGRAGILTLPGDIPCTTSAEIDAALAAHGAAPAFTIVPAHDEQGSNTVIVSPPLAVPLRFGDNSYFPHLIAARTAGIEPTIVRLPGIAMDIDHPADLAGLLRLKQSQGTRTRALLEAHNIARILAGLGIG